MAMRRRRSRSSLRLGVVLSWVGAVVALSALAMAGIGLAGLRADRAGQDAQTMCAGHQPREIVALLFDSSDPLNDLQRIKTRQILDETLSAVPKGARVDVYMATAEAGQLARPLFSRCNPASPDGSAGWSENPGRMQDLRRSQFLEPLQQALATALRANPRKTSPILETIAAASVQSFDRARPGDTTPSTHYTMVIVSDFLQNSAVLSHYRHYPSIEEFATKSGWVSTLPRLEQVYIKMIYINRANSLKRQNKAHRNWWCEYFRARGAAQCNIEQL